MVVTQFLEGGGARKENQAAIGSYFYLATFLSPAENHIIHEKIKKTYRSVYFILFSRYTGIVN